MNIFDLYIHSEEISPNKVRSELLSQAGMRESRRNLANQRGYR